MSDILGHAEAHRNAATGIGIEVGVLQVCPIHDDGMFTANNYDDKSKGRKEIRPQSVHTPSYITNWDKQRGQ